MDVGSQLFELNEKLKPEFHCYGIDLYEVPNLYLKSNAIGEVNPLHHRVVWEFYKAIGDVMKGPWTADVEIHGSWLQWESKGKV